MKETMATYAWNRAYTHNYVFGFTKDGYMWALWLNNMSVDEMLTLSTIVKPSKKNASRGLTLAFKGRATAAYMLGQSRGRLQCIGTVAAYESDYKVWHNQTKLNRGDYFEYVIARLNNVYWDGHNSTRGDIAGDLIIDGIHWQLKTNGGNFINERQMRN